ncbi:hypothetical protein V6N13_065005 [Hibiscus sabdariffa]|uniref:Uncharacterized protein n=1 Tax=Hibiscus sabdariffa TaxID=183260 RepID=A0ABR2QSJ2_9ROSI
MCTALACSCNVPTRDLDTKGKEINIKDGGMGEVGNDDGLQLGQERVTNGPDNFELIPTLKSNLKKTTTDEDENQLEGPTRKVRWPDAHGKDIARVKEFEPRVSNDGELEGLRNSCVCAIQ